MAAPKIDPQIAAHLEWLGFVQPRGLVVSAAALVRAGAILDRRDAEGQKLLRECVEERKSSGGEGNEPWLPDFRRFAERVLLWSFSPKGYAGTDEVPIPPELEVALPNEEDLLRPTYAVRERDPQEGGSAWQLLVRTLSPGQDFDKVVAGGGLEVSPHGRLERLLRQTKVPAGLLFNGQAIRLLSAPYGESSGWLDFQVAEMVQTAGRPISTALRLLLTEQRLLALPKAQRLGALLADSRKYQNEVSERLAEQVLHALYELLRGFQAAHDASKERLLQDLLREHPDSIYRGLLTVLLRLVFLLYAEERDMLPKDEVFEQHYSLAGLYDRLREDAALYPDTMDQRYGAWAQLLVLFRMVHDGASAGELKLPRRHGVLFDPDQYKFLEGRPEGGARQIGARLEAPLVSDGTIYRALEKLLVLDGERISYRALDVEEIGSVYQTIMGFRLETVFGRSAAIKSAKRFGAPTTVDLDALLGQMAKSRDKWLQERIDRKLSDSVKKAVAAAKSMEELHAALLTVIDRDATPDLVPPGAMALQPSEERRRSGSHYTPRSLTEPIVRTTLAPILKRLKGPEGQPPQPEHILDLKVCDPAMGSGAFLVEACRQLGEALIESWRVHGGRPEIPQDEDEVLFARRLVAQRCLYGVDRNPVAVDLAKVSLWLATLAKDHAFAFLDHALRHGDSLVGLSRRQIEAFHWDASEPQLGTITAMVRPHLERITELRRQIREAGDGDDDRTLRELWNGARYELEKVRLLGDLAVAAFFDGATTKERAAERNKYAAAVERANAESYRAELDGRRHSDPPLAPFHWEVEFPEAWERDVPGFDAFVGNPPFAGKNTVAAGNVAYYPEWLKEIHKESHGNADVVAHFFRRAFDLLRSEGALGLIATNTIAQGDTRSTGLRWICKHEGEIFAVRKRVKWPGLAAVVVSVVHIIKGRFAGKRRLDERDVDSITAFLFHRGGHDDPAQLGTNASKSFVGSYVLGMGFTFDDTDTKGVATPIAEMERLISKSPTCREVIFPYIGGEEVNNSPTHASYRYVINFRDWPAERASSYDECWRIIESRVKPERQRKNAKGKFILRDPLPQRYWQYAEKRPGLYSAIEGLKRVLVISQVTQHVVFAFLPAKMVYSHRLYVFSSDSFAFFCGLQTRVHEIWARFLGSSLEDRYMYAAADCFETFPFPKGWETHPALEAAGEAYYKYRSCLMVENDEGLTKTYNRFHDPEEGEPTVERLREMHSEMDRAVLDAYGWTDIPTDCEFLLDYEIDEEEWGNKKKPWRYRWPDEVRDEVLARLLELNAQRAEAEKRAGKVAEGGAKRKGRAQVQRSKAKKGQPAKTSPQGGLFE